MMKRFLTLLLISLLFVLAGAAQQALPSSPNPPPVNAPSAEFLKAADEVLAEMSRLLSLPVKSPLKKSVRTREEIRDYILRRLKEDKEPAKRYADQKALERFGLIPKGFQVEPFLVELLTEQIAGLYDPKAGEFFIADWISPEEQRGVMAHELTHALHDQHFKVTPWLEAAKPNDDAQLAREAVLEGAAMAAMVDYMLRGQPAQEGQPKGVRELGELDIADLMGDADKSPLLAKAPAFLRDALLFPYVAGTTFTQRVLRTSDGWADLHKVFENPPVSTQQVLHPDVYLSGAAPRQVTLPDFRKLLPRTWHVLDENVAGEFGLQEILKKHLGEERALRMAPSWAGDRYAILEQEKTNRLILVFRVRLRNDAEAARFFGNYSEALELKYDKRRGLFRRPNFFSFETEEGGVFLRCGADQCLSAEGTTRELFDKMVRAIGWSANPPRRFSPDRVPERVTVTASLPVAVAQAAR